MIPKNNFILTIFMAIGFNASSQNYFIANGDTTFCSNLECIVGAQGDLKKISYTNAAGEEITVKGKEELKDITTVHYYGLTSDKIPQNLNKPDGFSRFETRSVDGKIIVYQDSATDGRGKDKFILRKPDGTLYEIDSQTIESDIKPYLEQCPEFVKQYKGDYSKKEMAFMEMIRLYNSLCK